MSNIVDEVNSDSPKAFIRFMLYTDVNRRRATRVGQDIEVNFETVLGSAYDYGTQHKLLFAEMDNEPGQYIVAMVPYLRQLPHPERNDQLITVRFVYLTTTALWPFFEPIAGEVLNMAMLPE